MAQESHPEIFEDSGLGREKHPGLRLRGSGKWGVQIYHPVEGKVLWLGTYDTIEEAKSVYQKKKLEIALLCRLDKHKTPICAKDSQSACKRSCKGVRQKRPGRWSAEIRDPFKRKRLHLGTFNTPEEAADAYAKKRRDFDDALMALGKKWQRRGQAAENSNSTVTSQNSQGNNCTEHAEDEFGVGVINSYGQLIGEYSRIDDDLWLTGL